MVKIKTEHLGMFRKVRWTRPKELNYLGLAGEFDSQKRSLYEDTISCHRQIKIDL